MLVPFDEKLKDIALKIKDIAYKLGLIADYVVEYGTSGIWTYEKWASGKIVAETIDERNWGTGTAIAGSNYFARADIALPMSGVTWEKCEVEKMYGNMGPVMGVINAGKLEVYNVRLGSSNISNAKLLLRLIGRWK